MKFVNVRLLTSEYATAVAFWRDIMGLAMTYGSQEMGYTYFETGERRHRNPGAGGVRGHTGRSRSGTRAGCAAGGAVLAENPVRKSGVPSSTRDLAS